MYHKTHVGFVDTHAEGYRGYYHIYFLKQERILVLAAGHGVHARMVRQGLYGVYPQELGKLLHFAARQAVDNARATAALLDETDNVAVYVRCLGPYLIVEVGAVERRFEDGGICHGEVFLDVVLHLGGGGGRKSYHRAGAYLCDDRTDAPVFRSEIVAPLRYAVRLVDGIERYGN